MTPARTRYIVSDLHLEHKLCDLGGISAMVDRAEDEDALIIIAGDLFDAWIREVQEIRARPVYRILLERIAKRCELYVAGNHDSTVLYDQGLPAFAEYPYGVVLPNSKQRWYVEHGHLSGAWAGVFAALDQVDRAPQFRKIVRFAHKIPCVSTIGRRAEDPLFVRTVAANGLRLGCQVAIAGHTHKAAIQTVRLCAASDSPSIVYVNPGSCLGKAQWVAWRRGRFTLETA